MNVLSLFDGISCGQIALRRARVKVDKYYASEVDKEAIKVTKYHFPNTIQLGGVRDVQPSDLRKIDLLLGTLPRVGFKFLENGDLDLGNPKSKQFMEVVRVYEETSPKYFLFESVVMKKENQEIISSLLGVAPKPINSNLVSAQNRKRLYWTNISYLMPQDRGIKLQDIVGQGLHKATIKGGKLEVAAKNRDKCNTITSVELDNVLSNLEPGIYDYHPETYMKYSVSQLCWLQTLPPTYFEGLGTKQQAIKQIANGWTVDVASHILRRMGG